MSSTLGQRLRRARERQGLTQQALATKIGVAQPTIANWEAGNAFTDYRAKIEAILGPLTKKKEDTSGEKAVDTTEDEISSFGTWLRGKRESSGLSVPELAKKAGISAPTIYYIENGKIKNPQSSTKDKLADALNETIPKDVVKETEEEQSIQGLGTLIDFDPHDRSDWPKCHGVYVLYDVSQRPIYIGKADNIATRLRAHEDKFWFKQPIVQYGSYIEVKEKTLRHRLEQVMIKFLKANAVINKQAIENFHDDDG